MEKMSEVSNEGNYEGFLKEVLRDFDARVMSVQRRAEEICIGNIKIYPYVASCQCDY